MHVSVGFIVSIMAFGTGVAADRDILIYSQEPPRLLEEELLDMPAKFGAELPNEGLRAFVVVGEPKNGCGLLKSPPSVPNFTGNWVVLLARYNCSFEVKVRNAQAANYDGVIIHNVNSNELEIMTAKNPEGIKIPSVFIGQLAGEMIETSYLYDKGYFFVINGDLEFINSRLLLPFAIVTGLCFIVLIIFMIVKCMRERRRLNRHRLPNNSLKKIPITKFAKGDPYDMCAICLDDYVEGDKLRVLPCAHAYHNKCIDPWLTKERRVCPVCKRKVFTADEQRNRCQRRSVRQPRDSSSDTDTDNDRTPLVRSQAGGNRVTQGGTFTDTTAIGRVMERFAREAAERVREREGVEEPTTRAVQGSSCPETAPGNPFLAGLLNLRGDRFPRPDAHIDESTTDDRQSLIAAGPSSTPPRSSSERRNKGKSNKRTRKNRNRVPQESDDHTSEAASAAVQPSSDSVVEVHAEDPEADERGRIGVAALPNVHISSDSRRRGNDFIV